MLALCAFLVGGCPQRDDKGQAAPVKRARELPLVADGRGLLFSYFDSKAELRTVDRLAKVESTAQASVMVIDPKHKLGGDRVYVADLRKPSKQTGFVVSIQKRSVWLARTMPKVSRLERPLAIAKAEPVKKRSLKKRTAHRRRRPPKRGAQQTEPPSQTVAENAPPPKRRRAQVLLFSTSWCPSCRAAKAFFLHRGVDFVELDIERDPRAARQYAAIARAQGMRPGSVPLIVVGQKVFMGFSRFQIELALNQLPKG